MLLIRLRYQSYWNVLMENKQKNRASCAGLLLRRNIHKECLDFFQQKIYHVF